MDHGDPPVAVCPPGEVIAFGFTHYYSEAVNPTYSSCITDAIRKCTIGSTNCTAPRVCSEVTMQDFMHIAYIACAPPDELLWEDDNVVLVQHNEEALTTTCPGLREIVFGLTLQWSTNSGFYTCYPEATHDCPGGTSCFKRKCDTSGFDHAMTLLVCAPPDEVPSSVARMGYGRSQTGSTGTCPSGMHVAFGFTYAYSPGLDSGEILQLVDNTFACEPYQQSCSQPGFGTAGDDEAFVALYCATCGEGCSACDATGCTVCDAPALSAPPYCTCLPGLFDAVDDEWQQACTGRVSVGLPPFLVVNETATINVSVSFPVISGAMNATVEVGGASVAVRFTPETPMWYLMEIVCVEGGANVSVLVTLDGSFTPPFVANGTVSIFARPRVVGIETNPIAGSAIRVFFSEYMDQAAAEAAFSLNISGGPAISGVFSWEGPSTLVFSPDGQFGSTTYCVNVSSAALSLTGLPIAETGGVCYTTLAFVYYVFPRHNAVDVELQMVTVIFRESMNITATEAAFAMRNIASGAPIMGVFEWEERLVLHFIPQAPVHDSSRYSCELGPSARTASGNELTVTFAWSFTTKRVRPVVTHVTPTGPFAPLLPNITVAFSKPMNPGRTEEAFCVHTTGGPCVAGAFSWSPTSSSLLFTPFAPLADRTTHAVRVAGTAVDTFGNALMAPVGQVASFETVDVTPPVVAYTVPNTTLPVPPSTPFSVVFNEAMGRLDTSLVAYKDGTPVFGFTTWNAERTVLTFNPSPAFADDATFSMTLFAAADEAGNAMAPLPPPWPLATSPVCDPPCLHGVCVASKLCACDVGYGPAGVKGESGTTACRTALLLVAATPPMAPLSAAAPLTVTGTAFAAEEDYHCRFVVAGAAEVVVPANTTDATTVTCTAPRLSPSSLPGQPPFSATVSVASARTNFSNTLTVLLAACPEGYRRDAANGCFPCGSLQYSSFATMPNQSVCLPCPEGEPGLTGATSCVECADCTSVVRVLSETTNTSSVLVVTTTLIAIVLCACVALLLFSIWYTRQRSMLKYFNEEDATVRAGNHAMVDTMVKKLLTKSSTVRIGGGEFADVFKCLVDKKWVALKILNQECGSLMLAQKEFHREVTALSAISGQDHPAIVELYFFVENPVCIGMTYCAGGSLREYLADSKKKLVIPTMVRFAAEIASGMAAVHSCGFAHLDLKSDNLLLSDDLRIRIMDFGIAKDLTVEKNSQASPSQTGLHGSGPRAIEAFSTRYVDPGRLLCEYDSPAHFRAADVFSYGSVLWAISTRQEPFFDVPVADLKARLMEDVLLRPPPACIYPSYDALVKRCWEADPDARPSFCAAFREMYVCLVDHFGQELDDAYLVTEEPS